MKRSYTTIRVDMETLKKVKKLTNKLKEEQPISSNINYSDAISYVIDEHFKK